MKKRTLKRMFVTAVATAMTMSLVACGGSSKEEVKKEEAGVTIDQIKLGEDYTDIKADLKFLTHKTDIVDTKFKGYVEEFQKLYPNINIEYEGITDYVNDVTMRLSTGDWGIT